METGKLNTISLIVAALILVGIMQFAMFLLKPEASTPYEKPETFTYQLSLSGGEYVWHVARRCARPDEDIREIVYQIQRASGLKSAGSVRPGQIIQVPASCIDEFTAIGRVE